MAKMSYAEFCGMAPVLGLLMSVVLMRVGSDMSRKIRKGYRACQRYSGKVSLEIPLPEESAEYGLKGQLLQLLLKSPLLCVHTTLRLVANIPRYTAKTRSWAWPQRNPSRGPRWSGTRARLGRWSPRHWRYWKAWKSANGKKNHERGPTKEENKTYAEYKGGHPTRFGLGSIWKVDVKWTLRHGKGQIQGIKRIMAKSTKILHQAMRQWCKGRLSKEPYGRMRASAPSSWWSRVQGGLGCEAQLKQHKAIISKIGSSSQRTDDPSFLIKSYNRRLSLYRKIPLKTLSRWWGAFNQLELPVWLRGPAFSLYIWMYGCKLQEAAVEDLYFYRNLSEFFRRQLKPGLRPLAPGCDLVSPADGRVLNYGNVTSGSMEQVKGVFYSLQGFLGPLPINFSPEWSINYFKENSVSDTNCDTVSDREYADLLTLNPDNDLYHCIIYLAPGDYHRFHSPADWEVFTRRHFPGELFSVKPSIARWLQGLFNLNERACYLGRWCHGFFSMTAVGATNVGSINVNFDPDLQTNRSEPTAPGTIHEKSLYDTINQCGVPVQKGALVGDFNLGSTIVLVFEAPRGFSFGVEAGEKVQYGQALCFPDADIQDHHQDTVATPSQEERQEGQEEGQVATSGVAEVNSCLVEPVTA